MEILECDGRDHSTDAGWDSFTGVALEIFDWEEIFAVLLIVSVDLEVPPVGEPQIELGMVRRLHLDHIGHEVWSQQQWKSL